MVLASLSIIFALVFGTLAWRSLPHGWTLAKIGWAAFRAAADKPDALTNTRHRRVLDDGNRFFLAGLGWLAAGVGSAVLAAIALRLALVFLGIL